MSTLSVCISVLLFLGLLPRTGSQGEAQVPVQSLIDAARPGETVVIPAGVYVIEKTIRITKTITLRGAPGAILDGGRKIEIMVIAAPDVTVENLTFRNSGFSGYEDVAALRLYQCSGARVLNNRFENTFFGIYSEYSTKSVIQNNTLVSTAMGETLSGNGIHAWKSEYLTISGNIVSGHRDGIYFEFVSFSSVSKNHSFGNVRYGIHFMFSNDDSYTDNHFERNGAGIAVMYSARVTMQRNRFSDNQGDAAYGILLKDINDSLVEENLFESNTVGVVAEGSNRIKIRRNVFRNNGWAMKIQANCDAMEIDTNNFVRNTFDIATNGSLVLNKFRRNYWDRYEGFDINKDGTGDVPHNPVTLFSILVERYPLSMLLYRSAIVYLLDRSEKMLPGLTPANLKDEYPSMLPHALSAWLQTGKNR